MEFKWDDSLTNAPGWLEHKEKIEQRKKEREEAREGKGKGRKRKREGREAEEKKWLTEVHRVRGLRKKNQFGEEVGGWGEEGGVGADVLKFKKGVEGEDHLPSYVTQKRDRFEEEYDLGRQKKIRKKEEFLGSEGKKNVFQRIQSLEVFFLSFFSPFFLSLTRAYVSLFFPFSRIPEKVVLEGEGVFEAEEGGEGGEGEEGGEEGESGERVNFEKNNKKEDKQTTFSTSACVH